MDTNTLLALVSIVGVFVALVLILRIRRDDHKSFSWDILSLLFGSGIKSMVQHGVDSTAKAIKQQGVNHRASPGSGGALPRLARRTCG